VDGATAGLEELIDALSRSDERALDRSSFPNSLSRQYYLFDLRAKTSLY
jgi:hypothetical protein